MKKYLLSVVVSLMLCFPVIGKAADTTNTTDVNTSTFVGIESNPVTTVGVKSAPTMKIDSHNNYKNVNRQFLGLPYSGAPKGMEYFGPWQLPKTPWNVLTPLVKAFRVNHSRTQIIKYKKIWLEIYQELPALGIVTQVPWGSIKTDQMTEVGEMAVILNDNQCSEDGLQIARYVASENGANVVEFVIGWNQKPTAKGWHLGFGSGASGLVGVADKTGISGAGGTGTGEASLEVETLPFVKARFWHSSKKVNISKYNKLLEQVARERNHKKEKYEIIRKRR